EVVIAERPYVTVLYDEFASNHCQFLLCQVHTRMNSLVKECKRCRQVCDDTH
ncbi:SET and MYND domaincontaining protein 4like, partial [Caligus rogercresseyi]